MESSMTAQPNPPLTEEEYLAIERKAEFKSEFWNGRMYAMSGAQREHNVIANQALAELIFQLKESSCEAYGSDMRVRIPNGQYAYPDAVAACSPRFLDDAVDNLLNPALIIEVLSPSTEAYDRGKKAERYRGIPSMREYLLLAADRVHADLYTRMPDGKWVLSDSSSLDDTIELTSCDCRLKLSEVYRKVEFPESA
jgi:Uma2 family endonuclease